MAESDPVRRSEILSVLTAFLAVGFLMFCNGRYPIAICAWLGPLFMIHFTRGGKGLVRLPLAYLGLSFAFGYQFHGMTPFAGFDYWIFSGAFGIALLLPYVADRYLGLRLEGLSRSLVFPLAFVTSEYLVSISSPFGTWGSIAYSQYESLTLLQLLSIAGLSGIGFLIAWFAAVAAALWEAGFALSKVRRECAAFALCFTAVLLYGGGRLTVFPPPSQTIRVASITRPGVGLFSASESEEQSRFFSGEPVSPEEIAKVRLRSSSITDFLLERADGEAQAGAKLVTFGEINLPVLKEDEPALIQKARDLAGRRGIYIGLPLAALTPNHTPMGEDQLVMIDPSGQIAWEYRKTRIPPGEGAILPTGSGRLPVTETPFGRLGGAIAFDMDFPGLLLQAGRKHADFVVVPENEYPAVDPLHSRMALYRAVDEGFNLLLHASNSLSLACDYQGRVYGLMDHYRAADRVLVTQLATKGVSTIYSRGGYLFPWLCMAALCLLLLVTVVRGHVPS